MFAYYGIKIQVQSKSEFYCKIAKQVRSESEFLWCHDFSSWCLLSMLGSIYILWYIPWLIPLFFVCTVYRRHDQSCLFEPTLRSVFSTWTDVTIGVLGFNRRYDRWSQLQPTIGIRVFCDVTNFLRGICYQCYDWYTLITWLIPLFFVCTNYLFDRSEERRIGS